MLLLVVSISTYSQKYEVNEDGTIHKIKQKEIINIPNNIINSAIESGDTIGINDNSHDNAIYKMQDIFHGHYIRNYKNAIIYKDSTIHLVKDYKESSKGNFSWILLFVFIALCSKILSDIFGKTALSIIGQLLLILSLFILLTNDVRDVLLIILLVMVLGMISAITEKKVWKLILSFVYYSLILLLLSLFYSEVL
ncbi:MAG: hypothetical protein GXP45_07675 [bacterium]|nr:hypothetical protein [bacterium]